ncbi:hypothetical protein CPBF367_10490 [Xanthomonas arboricola pv. juglandis]|nr:hypothetical protein CPBF367_10490 [Xanthomonas arboricola pv. juglandis]
MRLLITEHRSVRQEEPDRATTRCFRICAADDRTRAKALQQRGMSKGTKRYPKRNDRIELAGLRAEAASRDFVRELRA